MYDNQILALVRWGKKQRQLIKRRQGLKSHIKLTYRFHQIGQDPWVKKSRAYYKEHPTKYAQ